MKDHMHIVICDTTAQDEQTNRDWDRGIWTFFTVCVSIVIGAMIAGWIMQ